MRLFSSFLFLLAPVALFATNPTIRVDRDPPNPTLIFNDDFTFGANAAGGGDFSFENATGSNWTELTVMVTLPTPTATITCGPGPFILCTIVPPPRDSSRNLYDIIFGPAANGGIPNGGLFSINLNNPGTDSGSWPKNQDFGGNANDFAPEPGAGMLALAGAGLMAGVGLYRRRRAVV